MTGTPRREHRPVDACVQGTDVENEGTGDRGHVDDILDGIRHHRRTSGTDAYVGAIVDRDVVRDVMYKRSLGTDRRHEDGWFEIHGYGI